MRQPPESPIYIQWNSRGLNRIKKSDNTIPRKKSNVEILQDQWNLAFKKDLLDIYDAKLTQLKSGIIDV